MVKCERMDVFFRSRLRRSAPRRYKLQVGQTYEHNRNTVARPKRMLLITTTGL